MQAASDSLDRGSERRLICCCNLSVTRRMAQNVRYRRQLRAAGNIECLRPKPRRYLDVIRSVGRISPSIGVEEELLAEAEVRLYRAKFEAILGIRYDPDEYDQIIFAYREAREGADAARLAAQHVAAVTSAKALRQIPAQSRTFSSGIAA